MDTRKTILLSVAILAFVIAGVYYRTHSNVKAKIPTEVKVNCVCLACRQHVRLDAKTTEPRPYVCPQCGQRAAYPLLVCRQCGKHFVPNLVQREGAELPGMPVIPTCPACGNTNVGGYIGDETFSADDLILPKWPS